MINRISKTWRGFVPQYYSHPQHLCAYYQCKRERLDYRRYCAEHAAQYKSEVDDQSGGKVIPFAGVG